MCPVLLVINNRSDKYKDIKANIFTPGQGICLQRLNPNIPTFEFDNCLAYGSWYDIQIIAHPQDGSDIERYLTTGIYLTYGKQLKMRELTDEKYRDHGIEWKCRYCDKVNISSVVICEHCHTNKAQGVIRILSMIPILGIPFSITNTVLQWGKAAQSDEPSDQTEAVITTVFTAVDVVAVPFIVGSLVKIPAKVAAQTGVELTAKTIFSEAGKPILQEICNLLGSNGIVGTVALLKMSLNDTIRKKTDQKSEDE